jgi:acyl-CoA synthetase (AMP-forming)/AMP-acid ligase II
VDDVLLTHPSISQVVVFSVPHNKLGEDVAAAIVLRDGQKISANEIRLYLSKKLAAFKIPNQIIFLDEIPTGSTGKLKRIGLAEKLGLVE